MCLEAISNGLLRWLQEEQIHASVGFINERPEATQAGNVVPQFGQEVHQSGESASHVKQPARSVRLSTGSCLEKMFTANSSYSVRFASLIVSKDSSLIKAFDAVPAKHKRFH